MDFTDFIYTVLDNEVLFVTIYLLFVIFYYLAFYRKLSFNIFDAFTVEMVTSAGAALCVYIMFVYGNPDKKYLFSFISCEIALYAAIFLVKYLSVKSASANAPVNAGITLSPAQKEYLNIFFFLVAVLYIIVQAISLKTVGLVLFSTEEGINHVNAYEDTGPLFIILFTMTPVFVVSMFIKRAIFKKFTLFDYGCIFLAVFSMFTSGSKSSFGTLFTVFAVVDYKFAQLENRPKRKIPVLFLVLLFVSVILIVSINGIGGFQEDSAIGKLFQRIILSGDGFIIGYDDSAIRYVLNGPRKTAFEYIFYPLYGKLTMLSGTTLRPTIVGTDLYSYAFGVDTAGANGRHNLLSVIFWGPYWGCLLSFLIGSWIGFVRFHLFEKASGKNMFYLIFICVLATIVPTCITDIYLFNLMLFMLISIFTFVLLATIISYEAVNTFKSVLSAYILSQAIRKQKLS